MSFKSLHRLGRRLLLWQWQCPTFIASVTNATLFIQTNPGMTHMGIIPGQRLSPNHNSQSMWRNCRMYTQDHSSDQTDAQTSTKISRGLLSRTKRRDTQEAKAQFLQMIEDKGKTAWSYEEWSEACNIITPLLKSPWDIMCMKTLHSHHESSLPMAQSLMSYLESKPEPVSRMTMAHYIALLGLTSAGSRKQENLVKDYYTKFIAENDLLDIPTIQLLVKGLSHTPHYTECLWLMEKCLENEFPSAGLLVNLIKAGLRFHDVPVCERVIEVFEQGTHSTQLEPFMPEIVKAGLDARNESGLELVANYIEKYSGLLAKEYLDEILLHFKRYQPGLWTGRYSIIYKHSGKCAECGHQMRMNSVTNEEFIELRDSFLNQVIVGSNVFFRSSPEEVERFRQFVSKQAPFDVLIDGLNVMNYGSKHHSDKVERLVKAVSYFTNEGKRVLVLSSMAIKPFLPRLLRVSPKPLVYLTSTTRADDVFLLYAALYSGKNTQIQSRDKLRDHCFKLDVHLRNIFNTWLQTVQIFEWFYSRGGEFNVKPVRSYSLGPCRDPGGWHFPVDDRTKTDPFGRMSTLCLRKSTSLLPRIGRPRKETKEYYKRKEKEKQQQKPEKDKEWFRY